MQHRYESTRATETRDDWRTVVDREGIDVCVVMVRKPLQLFFRTFVLRR